MSAKVDDLVFSGKVGSEKESDWKMNEFILDNGASFHMTGFGEILSDIRPCKPVKVEGLNGKSLSSSVRCWDRQTGKEIYLKRVYLLPNIPVTLISLNIKLEADSSGKLSQFGNHAKNITSLVLTENEQQLISTDYEGIVSLWDIKSRQLLNTLTLPGLKICACALISVSVQAVDSNEVLLNIKNLAKTASGLSSEEARSCRLEFTSVAKKYKPMILENTSTSQITSSEGVDTSHQLAQLEAENARWKHAAGELYKRLVEDSSFG